MEQQNSSNQEAVVSQRTVRWATNCKPPEIRYERFSVGLARWIPVSKDVISGWLKAGVVVCYNPSGGEW